MKKRALEERVEELEDILKNGVKYDEKLDAYILVWTERQIQILRQQVEEISKALN